MTNKETHCCRAIFVCVPSIATNTNSSCRSHFYSTSCLGIWNHHSWIYFDFDFDFNLQARLKVSNKTLFYALEVGA